MRRKIPVIYYLCWLGHLVEDSFKKYPIAYVDKDHKVGEWTRTDLEKDTKLHTLLKRQKVTESKTGSRVNKEN